MMKSYNVKIHNFPIRVLFFVILIPFIYPKGFDSFFPVYKKLFALWMMGSLVLMIGLLMLAGWKRLRLKQCLYWILACFAFLLLITIIDQGTISSGLQKLIAAPVLCLFSMEALKEYKYSYICCLADLFLVEFILALTIFSPFVMPEFFSESSHILFLGHVQTASQFGLLGILLAWLMHKLGQGNIRAGLLAFCSLLIMLTSGTVASLIAMAIIFAGILFGGLKKIRNIVSHPRFLFFFWLGFNAVLFFLTWKLDGNYKIAGHAVDLNGRMYIWAEVGSILAGHWLLGYGAYGVMFHVFWNVGTQGMNYAHNQILQCLLDGGIVYLVLFLSMMYVCLKAMGKCRRKQNLYFPCVCLFAWLMIMVIESATEYLYFYLFLILMAYLPEISALYVPARRKILIR